MDFTIDDVVRFLTAGDAFYEFEVRRKDGGRFSHGATVEFFTDRSVREFLVEVDGMLLLVWKATAVPGDLLSIGSYVFERTTAEE